MDYFLMVAAAVLLLLGALGVPAGRVSLPWLGMFCWCLTNVV
jgi:hypothetical protein